ncbi:hypothetical protein C1H46_026050 [Malus baccata]|uniref:Uncharacterized protein n=1 Tax=Malus baccata TaxID=106549 RepID=A0A540LPH2_MALBA|nr:hypothetical protein C1H46_026050 [Malus baccata]
MSSEIEVVEDEVQTRDRESASANSANNNGEANGIGEESLRNDVYTAAAYGDLEKLQRLHGGDVNATDHTGQTALHWSAVRGAIQVAELLLQEGARVNAADMYGYQATHVAAQYGQTAFLYHVVSKWNADPDVPDNDGRSPLHWAAYKGFADCIRLLLFLDAYKGRQDKEGCTPLHWAAIRGNLEACTVLVQAGKKEDLMVTDNTGLTPAQLAADKNHRQVAFFLGNARRLLDKRCDGNSRLGRISKLGLAPLLWCIIFVLLVTYTHSVIAAPNLPKLTAGSVFVAWLGVFLATSGLVLFYRCSSKDPGYIRMNVHDSQNMKDDVRTISRNITTNEMANMMRYNYLRGPGGRFRNPYDHGIRKNCSDFLIKGYNEDVEFIEESAHDEEGIGMRHINSSNLQNGDAYPHRTNGNSHVAINVNSNLTGHHGHVHSAHCSHSNSQGKPKTENVPLGLGLGLGRNSGRSVVAS